jgi:hypothetical protein
MTLKLDRMYRTLLLFLAALSAGAPMAGQNVAGRTLKICVAEDAAPEVKQSADRIRESISTSPLLSILGMNGAEIVDSGKLASSSPEARAYHHLILVGLPEDPLIHAAWQREAAVEDGGFYIFGFGHLKGTLGYIESDRNPYMHSSEIKASPYETEIITITGSTPAGVRLATDAFLRYGLINGVVAAPGWTRPSKTILDHDPLTLPLDLPTFPPRKTPNTTLIGVTQAGENVYRDVLADTGVSPSAIWMLKYYEPGVWDHGAPLEASAPAEYLNGLHRRAFGHMLWTARFASSDEATRSAAKIAEAGHFEKQGGGWVGTQPSGYFIAEKPDPKAPPAALTLWTDGDWVVMSTAFKRSGDTQTPTAAR